MCVHELLIEESRTLTEQYYRPVRTKSGETKWVEMVEALPKIVKGGASEETLPAALRHHLCSPTGLEFLMIPCDGKPLAGSGEGGFMTAKELAVSNSFFALNFL